MDPEWNDFDPEKTTGNFFGREIPDEVQLRHDVEAQREHWGGGNRNVMIDEEDEFDAMFNEEMGEESANAPKQIGSRNVPEEEKKQPELESLETPGGVQDGVKVGKTVEEMSDEMPQDIKDKIIDLEAEYQEKLRQTMLRNTF